MTAVNGLKRGIVWVDYSLYNENQKELFEKKERMATIWVADYDPEKIWGDDWDDHPHHSNAGPPYEDLLGNIEKIQLRLNTPFPKSLFLQPEERKE